MVLDEVVARFPPPVENDFDLTMEMHERVFATFIEKVFLKDFRMSVSSFNSLHSSQDSFLASNSSIND